MTTQVHRGIMDLNMKPSMDMPESKSSMKPSPLSKKQKNIPVELTSYGTTPSGKPRLFVCQVCTRAFARLEHLRRHERSHTKEKPFSCGVCQRKFSRRDLLLRHAQKLHAGCADAITRLRRKSLKRSNSNATNNSSNDYDDDKLDSEMDVDEPTPKNNFDPVQFNLNLFNQNKQKLSRRGSIKDSTLQRQVFDRKKLSRNRGASFSAQSGANYAVGVPEFNDSYPGADNVEFSTPQMLPTTLGDENSWLNNLPSIPGLGENASPYSAMQDHVLQRNKPSPAHLRNNSIISIDSNPELPNSFSHHGSLSHNVSNGGMLRSDSIMSNSSYNTFDSNMQYSIPTATVSQNEMQIKNNGDDYGYSFYDIPDSMGLSKMPSFSPLKHDLTDIMDQQHHTPHESNSITTNGVNFDLNFLYDIDELSQGLDSNSKFVPGGYSFYGDNPSVSSSGVESSTSPRVISPPNSQHHAPHDQNLLKMDSFSRKSVTKMGNYSRTKLFTSNIRYMINKSLSKYPISGIMTPTIPSNEKLEFYLSNFCSIFLSHFPFIHPSKLNEAEIMNMTMNEEVSNESARACLPLLVATIGALLANNKNDSEHLYEASRRTIHIYLESRKNSVNDTSLSSSSPQSVNPLWLIQSLTLSVTYGLFSENENNVYIVIRQLNALNSLVKTSIKSNRTILFSIDKRDEEIYEALQQGNDAELMADEEVKFRNHINVQCQSRIVFMIYRLTNFLLMMYNVPLTLSINDMFNLKSPNTSDEFLWNFRDYQSFKKSLNGDPYRNLDFFLAESSNHQIVFKEILFQLAKTDFSCPDAELTTNLSNLSKFGFNSVIHGLFEIKQYDDLQNVELTNILDNMSRYIDNSSQFTVRDEKPNSQQDDFEKLDFALLVNFVKINSVFDFKLVKEQSWLKNFEELTANYDKFLTTINQTSEDDYLRVIDWCIIIVKLVMFKTVDADDRELQLGEVPAAELFQSELNFYQIHHPTFNTLVDESIKSLYTPSMTFEKSINLKVFDEIDNSKISIHSQMLFHVFTILSIFAITIAKKNHERKDEMVDKFNQRFVMVLKLLGKIESFLKIKYQNSKLEHDIANLCLFSSGSVNSEEDEFIGDFGHGEMNRAKNNNYFNYSLEKSLYILKLGELIMMYLYDTNMKVSIFKKLGDSLSQIRKFLIDNESRFLL